MTLSATVLDPESGVRSAQFKVTYPDGTGATLAVVPDASGYCSKTLVASWNDKAAVADPKITIVLTATDNASHTASATTSVRATASSPDPPTFDPLLLDEPFNHDVVGSLEWNTGYAWPGVDGPGNVHVDLAAGHLVIGPGSHFNCFAETTPLVLAPAAPTASEPIIIEARSCLVSGGQGYVLPSLQISQNGAKNDVIAAVTANPQAGGWLLEVLGTQYHDDRYAPGSSGTWGACRLIVRPDSIELQANNGSAFETVISVPVPGGVPTIGHVGFQAPWTATCEADYVKVWGPR